MSDQVQESIAYSIASNYTVNSSVAVTDENDILPDSQEAVSGSNRSLQETTIQDYCDSNAAEEPEQFLGDTYRYSSEAAEGKLTWLCNAYQSYSLCPTEKYYILWDYISPVMEKIDPYCAAFSDLEICGYSLYESTLIVNILAKSSFTLDEAIAIYKIYPNTPTRMLELFLFNEYIKTLVNNQDISLAKHFYQWLLNAVY